MAQDWCRNVRGSLCPSWLLSSHDWEEAHKVEVLLVAENLLIPYWPFFQTEICALNSDLVLHRVRLP